MPKYNQAEKNIADKIIKQLYVRADELFKLGGVHIRESVALGEFAIILEKEYLKEE